MFLKLIVVLAYLTVAVQGACQWTIENNALIIPSNVVTITEAELSDCNGYTSVVIPASVTSIGVEAFYDIVTLTTLTFQSSSKLHTIDYAAFKDTAFTSVDIPASVTYIGESAFEGIEELTTLTFQSPSELLTIGAGAFYNSAITSVVIPASVTSIRESAFGDIVALTTLTFESGSTLTSIGGYAFGGTAFTSVDIPASVTHIGESAFEDAALTTLTFESPSELLTIGNNAFQNTAITSVDIPASVTSIGNGAFRDIEALTTITFEEGSELTSIGAAAFEGTNGDTDPLTPLTCTCINSDCPEVVTDYTYGGLENCGVIPEETVILTTTSEVNVGVVVGIFIAGIFVLSAIAYAFFTPKRESEQKAEVVQTTEEL